MRPLYHHERSAASEAVLQRQSTKRLSGNGHVLWIKPSHDKVLDYASGNPMRH